MQEHLIFQPEFTYIPVSPESIAPCASGVKRGVFDSLRHSTNKRC
jgi:hypothetical protein